MVIQTEIHGLIVDVTYSHYPDYRARRNKFGVAEEPGEDASIELDSVNTRFGEDITDILAPRIEQQLIEECWEHWKGDRDE